MNIQLIANWQAILKGAWSMRLNYLAMAFACLEVALPYLTDSVPPHVMAALAIIATAGATVCRLLAQPDLHKDEAAK